MGTNSRLMPAHLLAEAGHLPVRDGERGLRRHVARRGPGAAGGDDEVAAGAVHQLDEGRLDRRALVGDQAPLEADGVQERAGEPRLERGDALVAVDALRGAVARGDEADGDRDRACSWLAPGVVLEDGVDRAGRARGSAWAGARPGAPRARRRRACAAAAGRRRDTRGRSGPPPRRRPGARRATVRRGGRGRSGGARARAAPPAGPRWARHRGRASCGRCTASGGEWPRAWSSCGSP